MFTYTPFDLLQDDGTASAAATAAATSGTATPTSSVTTPPVHRLLGLLNAAARVVATHGIPAKLITEPLVDVALRHLYEDDFRLDFHYVCCCVCSAHTFPKTEGVLFSYPRRVQPCAVCANI